MSRRFSCLVAVLAPTVALADPITSLSGTCPGAVDLAVTDLTPGGRYAILSGNALGGDVIPGGPCAGMATSLANLTLRVLANADAQGEALKSPTLPGGVCGHWFQVLDVSTCTISAARGLSDTCDPASGSTVSCSGVHETCPALGDGAYWIDPDDGGGLPPVQAYCDMSTDGGGWTLVYAMRSDQNPGFFDTAQVGTTPITLSNEGKLDDLAIRALTSWTDPAAIGYRWTIEGFSGAKYHPAACEYGTRTNPTGTACADYRDAWTPGPTTFSTAPHCDGFRYGAGGLKATAFGGFTGGNVAWSNWNNEGHAIQGDNACAPWSYSPPGSMIAIWAY